MGGRARRRRARAGRAEPGLLPREALLDARRPRSPLARGAAAGRHLAGGRARRAARAPLGAARHGRHLRSAQPHLDARHVRRAGSGGGSAQDRRLHAALRRRARRRRRRGARDRRGVGARRPAGDRLARLRRAGRQDRRARQLVRERGEARGLARRRDRPARRPVRGGRGRRRRVRPSASSSSSSPRRPSTATTPSAASSRRSRRRRRSRPSTSCCSAMPRRSRPRCATRARSSSGRSSPVAAGDYATGGNHVLPTDGWARSVGGLGLETFLKPVTIQRITADGPGAPAPDDRGARRRRGHDRTRRGGAAMRALAPEFRRLRLGAADRRGRAARRHRPVAGAAVRPEHAAAAAPVDPARERSPARSRESAATRRAATTSFARAIADYAGVDPGPRRARGRRRRSDPALCPLLRRPGRHRSRSRQRRPIRCIGSRSSLPAPRSARFLLERRLTLDTTRVVRRGCQTHAWQPTASCLDTRPFARIGMCWTRIWSASIPRPAN